MVVDVETDVCKSSALEIDIVDPAVFTNIIRSTYSCALVVPHAFS